MSSERKISANQANSQHSTGPNTPAGKQVSALNATQHGFTGQTLVVTDAERPLYEAFSAEMLAEHRTTTAHTRDLMRNYIDLRWSIHQINAQQSSLMAQISDATNRLFTAEDKNAVDAELEKFFRRLRTLGTYESRRRKAAADTLNEFKSLEAALAENRKRDLARAAVTHNYLKEINSPKTIADFGFVYANTEIEDFLAHKHNEEAIDYLLNRPPARPVENDETEPEEEPSPEDTRL